MSDNDKGHFTVTTESGKGDKMSFAQLQKLVGTSSFATSRHKLKSRWRPEKLGCRQSTTVYDDDDDDNDDDAGYKVKACGHQTDLC